MAGALAGRAGILDNRVSDSPGSDIGDLDCLAAGAGHVLWTEGDEDRGVGVVVAAAAGGTVLVVEGGPAIAVTGSS